MEQNKIKRDFNEVVNYRKETLRRLLVLIKMQLKEKVDLSFLSSKRSVLFKSVFKIIGVVASVAGVFLGFSMLKAILSLSVSANTMAFILLIMQTLSVVACISGLSKSLYESKDNVLLLSFPVKPNHVFVSKLLVFYIYELQKNFVFFMAFFIGYGMYAGLNLGYFISVILLYVLLPLLPVMLGAILSIPLMLGKGLLKRYSLLTFIAVIAVGALAFVGTVELAKLLPDTFRIIGQWNAISSAIVAFIDSVAVSSWFFLVVVNIPLGVGWFVNLMILLGLSISSFVLAYWIARPLFFRIASRPITFGRKKTSKQGKNIAVNYTYFAYLRKEFITIARNFDQFASGYMFALLSPILILLLNAFYTAMPVSGDGYAMQLSFNVLLIVLCVSMGSTASAAVYSSEGASFFILKAAPVSPIALGLAKITVNVIVSLLSVVACGFVMQAYLKTSANITICTMIVAGFAVVAHSLWSVQLDLLNPQLREYKSDGQNINNSNIRKSIFIGLAVSLFFGLVTLALYIEDPSIVWTKMIAMAGVFLIAQAFMFVGRLKIYFRAIEQ